MDFKGLFKRLIFLPVWLMALLLVACVPLLVLVFLKGFDTHPLGYFVYVLSFYTLAVWCVFLSVTLPKKYKSIKNALLAHRLTSRLITDAVFRARLSLYTSFFLNLLFVAVNVVLGAVLRTAWFYIFAVYYAVLATMRAIILRYIVKNEIGVSLLTEWKIQRVCAYILTLTTLSLSSAVLMIIYQDKGFDYPGLLIYVVATYTFYMLTVAIVDIVKYRKHNSPTLNCSKIIALVSALVSMIMLETAMLGSFGVDTPIEAKRSMIVATGAGIGAAVLCLSVYMIVHSSIEIRKLTQEKTNND